MVYFIESGQIKLLMLSSEGRECILAIHSAEIFWVSWTLMNAIVATCLSAEMMRDAITTLFSLA